MSVRFILSQAVAGPMLVRTLGMGDLEEVIGVQRSAYPDAPIESPGSFTRKLRVWPTGARGAFEDDELIAYLFCHPWTLGEVAPLDALDLTLPEAPSCLYVHDLAVRADRRGQGAGDRLVAEALKIAEASSLGACALTAVQDSRRFWERHGFVPRRELEYGTAMRAWYMVRDRTASSGAEWKDLDEKG